MRMPKKLEECSGQQQQQNTTSKQITVIPAFVNVIPKLT